MSVYSIYFSPTGGTKKVMEILAEGFSVDGEIDLSVPDADYSTYRFQKGDVCLIGVPSYGGRVPDIALRRMKELRGGGAMAAIVVVYGNRAYDDTMLELKEEVEAQGFRVCAAVAAVAEHSIMRQFAEGRPDETDAEELRGYGKRIRELAAQEELVKEFQVPGNTPYKKYGGVPLKPNAGKTCTKCGLCAEKCPVRAIPKENPGDTDNNTCISCMRCIAVCPQKARSLNKVILFGAAQGMKAVCSGRKPNEFWA